MVSRDVAGTIGGLLIFWNKETIKGKILVSSKWLISIFYHNKLTQEDWVQTNVYAPIKIVGQKALWEDLSNLRALVKDFPWVLVRYFNTPLTPLDKKWGSTLFRDNMQDF